FTRLADWDTLRAQAGVNACAGVKSAMSVILFNLLIALILAATVSVEPPESSFRILVKKSERKLYLYETVGGKERLRKTYSIALGNTPIGHKRKQGDGKTPEGEYYITHKNPKSNFYLSLGVSYPNLSDADEGLKAGLITRQQHDAIATAIRAKSKPPQNTKLGGDIFIHGHGVGSDWTLGCVALENQDIKELFDLLPVKTPVKIVP
ncbi:MAG: L,D-transpeptidase family protein, partial [Acidobacteria bacterium]|nr:L,D-transpeptidase family protein [Acidobacteriota bacterium]